ncbi:MAG: hypothetical protein JW779_06105 [Candidatus Thorarchaeota archaeon]|nr:hypothetical protein [Candidatus Thorarchaeota archaeon]
MKLRFQDNSIPYPISIQRGKLRLSGLDLHEISDIISSTMPDPANSETLTENQLIESIRSSLSNYPDSVKQNYDLLMQYEQLRGEDESIPPLVLVLEGASATGKSLLAIELIQDLTATRFISTDTVRQLVRGVYQEKQAPEIFCHTYQAYRYKQLGDQYLHPVVRGYLAQIDLMKPFIDDLIQRVLSEGTQVVVEGVHIQPGSLNSLSDGILEVLVNPSVNTHRAMFFEKHASGKLRTVTSDKEIREQEFNSTRLIQDYLVNRALENEIPIIKMESYEKAREEVSEFILKTIKTLLKKYS